MFRNSKKGASASVLSTLPTCKRKIYRRLGNFRDARSLPKYVIFIYFCGKIIANYYSDANCKIWYSRQLKF